MFMFEITYNILIINKCTQIIGSPFDTRITRYNYNEKKTSHIMFVNQYCESDFRVYKLSENS